MKHRTLLDLFSRFSFVLGFIIFRFSFNFC